MGNWRETGRNLGLLVLRVGFGLGLATHGYSKLFGGHIADFAKFAVEPMGFPMPLVFAYFSGLAEFAGGLFVAVGLLSRLTTVPVIINLGVALAMVHLKHGDPFQKMELAVVYLACAVTVLLTGPGAISIDRLIFGKKK